MKKIGTRIAVWYALSATATLVVLFAVGYFLLRNHFFHDLDILNRAEFEQISARLSPHPGNLTRKIIDQKIRETTNYASVLFYINIDYPKHQMLFYSNNLDGRPIPDVPHKHIYNTSVAGIGQLRVAEFLLPPFDVTIGTPTRQIMQGLKAYMEVCVALVLCMLMASFAIGIGFSHLTLKSLRAIGATARRIRSDNLAERIPVSHVEDEITDLAKLLNQTFDRLELAFRQSQQFAAEVSHELKTPLSLIRLNAEQLLVEGHHDESSLEAARVQIEELERVNQLIDDLLFISRAEANGVKLKLRRTDPREFLNNVQPDLQALVEHDHKHLVLTHQGDGWVDLEEKWLRQVVFNLLTNALRVSPDGSSVVIKSSIAHGRWCLSVEDGGPGLSRSQCQRAFDRFVRFDVGSVRYNGNGLGLAICRTIIDLHAGSICAEPLSQGGLRVYFKLPLASSATVKVLQQTAA